MKFRRLVFILILAAILASYFTKPGKEDFIKFMQPAVNQTHIPPVVEYEDKFLYSKVTATYADIHNPVLMDNRTVAPARKEIYIGFFKRFWKQNK